MLFILQKWESESRFMKKIKFLKFLIVLLKNNGIIFW